MRGQVRLRQRAVVGLGLHLEIAVVDWQGRLARVTGNAADCGQQVGKFMHGYNVVKNGREWHRMIPESKMDTVIDWDRIDTVWLDLDGTVLDLHFDVRFWHEHLPARYAQTHGIERALAEQRLAPLFADTA